MTLDLERDIVAPGTEISWQRFSVPYEYPVAFTRGLFDIGNPLLADVIAMREPDKVHKCLVFIDEGIAGAHQDLIKDIGRYFKAQGNRLALYRDPITIPGGERIKTELSFIEGIQDAVHQAGVDRHSYVIAIGGGAVLDAIGLAAATAHRGVRHIRVPTTVLSQNDSGVGVKNAVNLKGIKNYIGTFAPPFAVLNDFDFLEKLPRRERIAGIAEAVKVALIRDREFFEWLEANADGLVNFEPEAEEYMVRRCAALHMRQIAHGGDPFEQGSARPLDFGHWSAHKLEAMTRHRVRHGEAVAIGIALDARYSVLSGLLNEGEDVRIAALLEHLGFRIWHPALGRIEKNGELAVLVGLRDFQEHLGGDLTVTLLADIGVGHEVNEIDPALVLEAVDWLSTREGA